MLEFYHELQIIATKNSHIIQTCLCVNSITARLPHSCCFPNYRVRFRLTEGLLHQRVISNHEKSFTKVTSPLGSIAQACRFKSCRAHHSEMTFGCQAAAQSAPASTTKVFLRSKSWPLTLGHDFVFEAIDLRCSSTDFVSR